MIDYIAGTTNVVVLAANCLHMRSDVNVTLVNPRAADLGLERPDHLADAGLREAELLGRAAEVELLGDREEHADLPKLDRRPHRLGTVHGR
jgi:hypothetical protein